ncbi:MAG: LPS export ABC transporter permease LptG [Alphaproteobacteria bacterium]|nr:LPS export ABC transporter permease LptG [Alphaproteobacteria bacterium]
MKSKLSSTLFVYLARRYVLTLIGITALLLGIIYLFDTVELLRRAAKRDGVPLSLVLEMGLLKLPDVGQTILPFAVLFSALFTFWQLNRKHELAIMRAAGFSVWQFLAPVVAVTIFAGIFQVAVVNPAGSLLLSRFETLENNYLSRRNSHVALFKEGLWLRQNGETQDENVIIYAEKIALPDWRLHRVMVLFFAPDNRFLRRIDAPEALLGQGGWTFYDATVNEPGQITSQSIPLLNLPTALTTREIEDSFSSPETVSFWSMPGFIKTLESTGFDAVPLKIRFQALLAQPFLFAAMILLAAAVSLRPPRQHGGLFLLAGGIGIGFALFFLSSFLQALGASHQIPIVLAAWSPSVIALLLGTSVLMNLEDG